MSVIESSSLCDCVHHCCDTHSSLLIPQLFCHLPVAPNILMDSEPDDVETVEGMNVAFMCAASGRPRPNITWYRDAVNSSLLPVNLSNVRVTVNQTEEGERVLISELTLRSVLPSDSGVYTCIADNVVDSTDVRNATLTVNGELNGCMTFYIVSYSFLFAQCYQ